MSAHARVKRVWIPGQMTQRIVSLNWIRWTLGQFKRSKWTFEKGMRRLLINARHKELRCRRYSTSFLCCFRGWVEPVLIMRSRHVILLNHSFEEGMSVLRIQNLIILSRTTSTWPTRNLQIPEKIARNHTKKISIKVSSHVNWCIAFFSLYKRGATHSSWERRRREARKKKKDRRWWNWNHETPKD